jgi:hypothetical protein
VATPVTTTAAASATRLRRSSSSLPIIGARTCPAPPAPRRLLEARPRSPGRTRSACALRRAPPVKVLFLASLLIGLSDSSLLVAYSYGLWPSDMDLAFFMACGLVTRRTDMMGPLKLIALASQPEATVQQLIMLLTKS